jgi:N-glycosylase/DNA lyase
MDYSKCVTVNQIMHEYPRLKTCFQQGKKWNEMSETELWEELCLCILSSNVPYELALSAFSHLRSERLLRPKQLIRRKSAVKQLSNELSKRIYSPKTKNGSYRKYRFPNTRAQNIVKAARTIDQCDNGLMQLLRNANDEEDARDFLTSKIPGIGLKQASHFLRNIRYSESLAIIDSHVIAFLAEIGTIPNQRIKTVTPEIYMKLEKIVRSLSKSLDTDLSVFDMAVWQYMRRR